MNGIVVHQKVGGSTTLCTEGKKRNVAFTKFFFWGGALSFFSEECSPSIFTTEGCRRLPSDTGAQVFCVLARLE